MCVYHGSKVMDSSIFFVHVALCASNVKGRVALDPKGYQREVVTAGTRMYVYTNLAGRAEGLEEGQL